LESVAVGSGILMGKVLTGALAALLILPADAAWAHGADPHALFPFDVWSLSAMVLAGVIYASGLLRAFGRRGRLPKAHGAGRVALVASGFAALAVALLSPLEDWAGELLSAHMVQHVILIAIAPALLVMGRAEPMMAAGLPAPMRASLARGRARTVARYLAPFATPMPAALIHAIALWVWHAPVAFDAAARDDLLHFIEHVCFFGTALLLWRALAKCSRDPAAIPGGLAANLFTLIQGGFMGALIALAPAPLYAVYAGTTHGWGLTALEDQELAGTIMWVPASLAYLFAALALAAKLIGPDEQRPSRPEVSRA
jgi:putative membrane protein